MPKSIKKIRKIYPHTYFASSKIGVGVYLDYASSVTPNPSSIHALGIATRKKLEIARKKVASILGCRQKEIIFTSGGTESNNLAIQGAVFAARTQHFFRSSEKIPRPFKNAVFPPHIVATNIEHPSVLETYKMLEKRKLAEISIVPVEANGIVDPKKIKKALKKNTILVSVMYVNNEIGTVQPIKEIAKEIRHYKKHNKINIFFHTDAVQAVNYLDLNVEKLGVDLLTLSGAKVEEAGKVGVLYKKSSVPLANVFGGGDQEMGLRPGTENLPEILKFSSALNRAQKLKEKETKKLKTLQNYFFKKLITMQKNNFFGSSEKIPRPLKNHSSASLVINGDLESRLPNNINITFPKIPSDLLVLELSARGIMCSSKSACKSSRAGGSYVIKALRAEADPEIGGVRFSLGRDTTKKDIDYTVKSLFQILIKLGKWYY